MVRCTANDIIVREPDDHSTYIEVVVSIRQDYLRNLLGLEDRVKQKLIRMNIDCFIADSVTVFLTHPNGKLLFKIYLTIFIS